ncbi:hypothetical protein HPB50_025806 [Hyalomma asiaticum]|uniref:Uncharacterized protein n=1 Tax=Hyalomma asiaticum TaxID=266040 RepID=A0ACB7SRB8_HYAAI|nr:hypothetical protein HPB50_025806 [Hyalomma asiaticum]
MQANGCKRLCDTGAQAQGSFAGTGAPSPCVAVLHLSVGQLPPKNVSLSAWRIRHNAAGKPGDKPALDRASPCLLSSVDLGREQRWWKGNAQLRPGAAAAAASLARTSLPLLAGPIQPPRRRLRRHVTPLAERLKTPRRAPVEPDRASTARSPHRNPLASVSSRHVPRLRAPDAAVCRVLQGTILRRTVLLEETRRRRGPLRSTGSSSVTSPAARAACSCAYTARAGSTLPCCCPCAPWPAPCKPLASLNLRTCAILQTSHDEFRVSPRPLEGATLCFKSPPGSPPVAHWIAALQEPRHQRGRCPGSPLLAVHKMPALLEEDNMQPVC